MLKTVSDVITELGGTFAAAASLGVEPPVVSMWKSRGRIPAKKFEAVSVLLRKRRKDAAPEVFGFDNPREAAE